MSQKHAPSGQRNFAPQAGQYKQRKPEQTVLYQAVAQNLRTFEALVESNGKCLPDYVSKEFEAFLRCGVLAHGFLRLRCEGCKYQTLLAFSCKKRGFCSSCGGRRMAESAAHLIDEVLPKVGVRQWVLSFPMPIRFILAKNSKIQGSCLTLVHRAITGYIRKKAKQKGIESKLQPGAVTLIQRAGGALNLNVHYHMLFLDGGFYESSQDKSLDQKPKYAWVEPPTDQEIKDLVETLAKRVIRFLKKKGYFQDDVTESAPEEDQRQEELLPELQAASVQSRIALGERRGQKVRRLGQLKASDFQSELKGPLCAQVLGFSLHAGVYCAPQERKKLEKLCRYVTRPAVAEERLKLQPNGDIVLRLKTKYSDGTSHLLFSGLEFIEKLAALVAPPRIHLTRFFGCLAPNSKIRSQIVPEKPQQVQAVVTLTSPTDPESVTPKRSRRTGWVELLARVFAIDMQNCPNCPGQLKVVAAIVESSAVKRIRAAGIFSKLSKLSRKSNF